MLTKEKVLQAIEAMPQDSFESLDALLESLVIWDKLERGLKDMEIGNTLTTEEVEKEVASWFH